MDLDDLSDINFTFIPESLEENKIPEPQPLIHIGHGGGEEEERKRVDQHHENKNTIIHSY